MFNFIFYFHFQFSYSYTIFGPKSWLQDWEILLAVSFSFLFSLFFCVCLKRWERKKVLFCCNLLPSFWSSAWSSLLVHYLRSAISGKCRVQFSLFAKSLSALLLNYFLVVLSAAVVSAVCWKDLNFLTLISWLLLRFLFMYFSLLAQSLLYYYLFCKSI